MKSGWKTTEFWMLMLSNTIGIVGSLKGIIPVEAATKAMTVLNIAYALFRTLAKVPDITTLFKRS